MRDLAFSEQRQLIADIAARNGKASELAKRYNLTVDELRAFVEENRESLQLARDALENTDPALVTPTQLSELWITNKFDRLLRYQQISDWLFELIRHGVRDDAVILREFRAYLRSAAEELGQLLHRGSGDAGTGDMATYTIEGVDMNALK